MKINLIVFLLILSIFPCFSKNNKDFEQISDIYANKIANIIYIIEGGDKTKYPYGIKSIDTGGNKEKARRICLNTIKNNYIRWQKAGLVNNNKKIDYLDFLADRYCPPSDDPIGNKNWKKNIKKLLNKS